MREKIKNEIMKILSAEGFKNVELIESRTKKVNGGYEAISVRVDGASVCPAIDMTWLQSEVANAPDKMEQIVGQMMASIIEALNESQKIDVSWFADFSVVRNKLSLAVCSMGANEELLKEVPHYSMEDLAVYCRVLVEDVPGHMGSVVVNTTHLATWGISEEELFSAAREATVTTLPLQITDMRGVLLSLGVEEEEFEEQGGVPPMFVCSNNPRVNGAGVIAYPGFYESVKKATGYKQFYIIPSSVHECLVFKKQEGLTLDELTNEIYNLEFMIHDINRTQLNPSEVLSYRLYRFDENGNFGFAFQDLAGSELSA